MKKFCISFILFCIFLSGCSGINRQNSKPDYYSFSDSIKASLNEYDFPLAIELAHIKSDSSYELIIMTNSDTEDTGAIIYTIVNGKSVRVKSDTDDIFGENGGFQYYDGLNCFLNYHESVTDDSITEYTWYYKINDEGLAELTDETSLVSFFDDSIEPEYSINDTSVTKEEYENFKSEDSDKLKTVTFDKCTEVNSEQEAVKYLKEFN